jgi:hypothetical protein
MKEKADYSISPEKIVIKKDNRVRCALVGLQALSATLCLGGVFLWILLDSNHFGEKARSLALWIFPLTIAFFLLSDLWLFWYLKKSEKEVLTFTPEGIRIEGWKKPKEIKQEDISRIYFPASNFGATLKTIEIDTRSAGVIVFRDAAVPTKEIPALKKAMDTLLHQ